MPTATELAEALYEACPTVKPRWDQLGGVTQSVWIERAEAMLAKQAAEGTRSSPCLPLPLLPPHPRCRSTCSDHDPTPQPSIEKGH